MLSPSVCGSNGDGDDDDVVELRARCMALETEGSELREQLIKMEDAACSNAIEAKAGTSANDTETLRSELQALALQAERDRQAHDAEVAALRKELSAVAASRASASRLAPDSASSGAVVNLTLKGMPGSLNAGGIARASPASGLGATEPEAKGSACAEILKSQASRGPTAPSAEYSPPQGHLGGSVTPRLFSSDGATGGSPFTPIKSAEQASAHAGASPSLALAGSLAKSQTKSQTNSPPTCITGNLSPTSSSPGSAVSGLRATMGAQRSPQTPIATCPQGHKLQLAACRPGAAWVCDGCEKDAASFTIGARYRCPTCDYDLCVGCRSRQGNAQAFAVTCPGGHVLRALPTSPSVTDDTRWVCDGCEVMGELLGHATRYRCTSCDYDLCEKCFGARRGRTLFSKNGEPRGDRRVATGSGGYPTEAAMASAMDGAENVSSFK